MKTRHYSDLERLYAGTHPIRPEAPEMQFMTRLCAGDADGVCAMFGEEKLFGGLPAVDIPYGRFEGQAGIREFAETWLKRFGATERGCRERCTSDRSPGRPRRCGARPPFPGSRPSPRSAPR